MLNTMKGGDVKAIVGLLLLLVPFAWFYIRYYAKQLKAKMEVNLFLDSLHNALVQSNMEEAYRIFNGFCIKSLGDRDVMYQLDKLPMTRRNIECLQFMQQVDEVRSEYHKEQAKIL